MEQSLQQPPDVVLQEEGDMALLYNMAADRIFAINKPALMIWKLCNAKRTPNQIKAEIRQQYLLDESTEEKIDDYISYLSEHHLITPVQPNQPPND